MRLSQMLLPEFDQEMAHTRKTLERIPEDRLEWQPHPKSMSMARLATHLATIPHWGLTTLEEDSFDVAPPGGEPYRPPEPGSRAEILELFDANVAACREALAATEDAAFGETWTLLQGGEPLFSLPRLAVVRGMILNHAVHHRAQLGVYLRLNDVPVPSIYGPSADES